MSNTSGVIKAKVRLNQVIGSVPVVYWYTDKVGTSITVGFIDNARLVKVYKGGLLLQPDVDYTIDGTTITFETPLVSTDKIAVEAFVGVY